LPLQESDIQETVRADPPRTVTSLDAASTA
jgi:hypothetical protein